MPASVFARFNRALVVWIAAFLSSGSIALWMLNRAGHLPPPPLTATNCIDEKFKFLHETTLTDRNLIAVGSSVTWRNLDFSAVDGRWKSLRPVNAAPCYLQIHQTAYLTEFLLDEIPTARVVVSVVSMQDFQNCSEDEKFFDSSIARRYISARETSWHLYFTNFRPRLFLQDVAKIRSMRDGTRNREPLVMDQYGSGPLTFTPPEVRSDRAATPECLKHMERLARELRDKGVAWVVVLLPPMPAWGRSYDPSGSRDLSWRQGVKAHLERTGTVVLDGRFGPAVDDNDFTDPDHLHWSTVPAFTRWIFRSLNQQSAIRAAFKDDASAL
ncbi:hypothetical protein [Methylobacterium iners]|uniref:SGNH hydrolase-type esterase domain-containing protein n=1 Tax=Methylobacterium iners TaxID=418707 RepID=A0ABQ4S7S1_9HYPH|nr:hypothetical protein [Methylobacterium iners]GJD97919.1 hypothetical protein OCOJLMKI_5158 [Methylobacterium iners]